MSSYFTGSSKSKKAKLYTYIQRELANFSQIKSCFMDDNMDHLQADKEILPEVIAEGFEMFFSQEQN
ncbi:hypothetical protein GCM10009122_12240 [Fulvivirga kasyanovii]